LRRSDCRRPGGNERNESGVQADRCYRGVATYSICDGTVPGMAMLGSQYAPTPT
jgi:hypothetical protein